MAAATFLAKVGGLVMALVGSIAVSRSLGPEGRGAYAVIVAVATTAVTLGHLSVGGSVVALWENVSDKSALRLAALFLGLFSGGVAAALAWVVTRVVWLDAFSIESVGALAVALIAVPMAAAAVNVSAVLLAGGRVGRVNAGVLLAGAIQTAGLLVLTVMGRLTVTAVVVLWALNLTLPLFVLLGSSERPLRPRAGTMAIARQMLSVGARIHLGLTAAFLLFRVDIFLLNSRVTVAEVGFYSLAVSLIEMTYILTESMAQVALHRQATVPVAEAAAYTARLVRISFGVALVGAVAVVAAAPLFVPVVFGSEFGPAVSIIVALAPGIVALGTVRSIGNYAVRQDRALLVAVAYLLTLGSNIGFNLVLIPRIGAVGAGLASSIAYLGFAVLAVWWFSRSADISGKDLIPLWSDFRDPMVAILADRKGRSR